MAYHNSDTESFVMDDLGNRTGNQTLRDEGTVNFTPDPLTNRYTAIAGHPLAYDAAGNLTQDKDGYQFTYDYENRITRIYEDNNSDGSYNTGDTNIAEYAYDTRGRRIRVYDAVTTAETRFYYSDNWQVLAEYDGSGVQQAYYIFGNYIDEVLLMNRGGSDKYYLHDHLYSPVALLDNSGNVVERYEYDAYGSVQILSSGFSVLSSSQYGNPYYFTGRELDTLDAGSCTLMHYRHRTYDPETGRFMQRDPLGINPAGETANPFEIIKQYADSLGLYAYTSNNPLYYRDPRGLRRVRIQILIEYVNNAKNFPLPSMSSIENEYKSIVTPCFTKLTCGDEVTIKFALSSNTSNLGLIVISTKPIAYRNLVSFDGTESNTVPIALAGGDKTTVWPYVFEKQTTGTKWYQENRGIAYANILVHETLWHGLLGKWDDKKAKPGTFRSTACDRFKMVLTEDDCKLIRKKLEVE